MTMNITMSPTARSTGRHEGIVEALQGCNEESWREIGPRIQKIYMRENMTMKTYLAFYNKVYDYCTSPMYLQRNDRNGSNECMEILGAQLYGHLKDSIITHVKQLATGGNGKYDESVLSFYSDNWKLFLFSSTVLHHVFQYLNKHWVRREIEDGNKRIFEVYSLALVIWRETLLGGTDLQRTVTRAVIKLIERERRGETINSAFITLIKESFVELGITNCKSRGRELTYYKDTLEKELLENTRQFYSKESSELVQLLPFTDYMKKADIRLTEEKARVDRYLHESSLQPVVQVCEDVLIQQHLPVYYDEFQILLNNDCNEDMERMYKLVRRTKSGLEQMVAILEMHITKQGLEAIEAGGAEAVNDPQMYIQAVLRTHSKYYRLVASAFLNDSKFKAALDKACQSFINRNSITRQKGCSEKSPQLLAGYCHQLLKKTSKMVEEEELENILTQIMIVFKYLEAKDTFQKHYSKYLAVRLVEHLSVSDDAESSMLSRLKAANGNLYTSKLQKMFQDVEVNKNLNDRFKTHLAQLSQTVGVDFNIEVLTHGSWPFTAQDPFALPKELDICIHQFTNFYAAQYSGRRLSWLYNKSRGDIVTNCFLRRYTFQASTYQMAVLMQYNHADSYTLEQLTENTQIPANLLQQVLRILLNIRLLICREASAAVNEEQTLPPSAVLSLFQGFKHKKLRVNINMPLKSEVTKEQESTDESILAERRHVMEAAIVRIMKMRQTRTHNELVLTTIDQLKSRFIPSKAAIKSAIERLIDQEYMRRGEDAQTYIYIA